MALKIKDKRSHHLSSIRDSQEFSSSPRLPKRSPKEHLPPVFSSLERIVGAAPKKSSRHSEGFTQGKGQVIIVACHKHPEELLKFLDVSSSIFPTFCEVCIVDSDNDLRQMKLERITDCHSRMKKVLKSQIDQLRTLEGKIESMIKDLKISNATMQPMLDKIEYMEKQTYYQVDQMFRRLKQRFTKQNSFKSHKDEIQDKVADLVQKLNEFNQHNESGLTSLKTSLRDERKIKEENKHFLLNMTNKLENKDGSNKPDEREIGLFQNAFDDFLSSLTTCSERFVNSVK